MSDELKFECGWWLPETDTHLAKMMKRGGCAYKNRLAYQYNKFSTCLNMIPENRRRVALDVGSNIGTWTYNLVDYFNYIHCFEPVEIHRNCWVKNLEGYTTTVLYDVALGDKNEKVKMFIPNICTAGAYIPGSKNHATDKPKEDHKDVTVVEGITVERLDNYNFEDVDFIKLDVEGYELNVLKGAKKTIFESKPYIFLEQKADNLYAIEFLEDMGMYKLWSVMGDYFMGWDRVTDKGLMYNLIERTLSSNSLSIGDLKYE